ncbi:MAG TPA: MarR family winged helix-turn-helix transcriptional regulator [Candidatus Limnocylindrales bacterium]|nr:MarR family winged helix-turn-helix transcriptional regulator [Candidatus Limnocylindrales bacterium]
MVTRQAPSRRAEAALEAIAFGSVAITSRALLAAGLEVTFAQWRVLVVVGEDRDGATVSEIATRLGAEISPASRLVSRLRRRGLVETHKEPRDRRVTRVRLTATGQEAREAVLRGRQAVLRKVVAESGPQDAGVEDALERIGVAFLPYR